MAKSRELLSAQLSQELRHRIMSGDYPQGLRLTEQRLSDDLEVSRVPVREALPLLAVEGFVQSLPNQGYRVHQWTMADVDDLFDVRLALEGRSARLAADRVARGEVKDPLREAYDASLRALADRDPLNVAFANGGFHSALVEASGNALMTALMTTVSGRIAWLFQLTSQRSAQVACAEHGSITNAIAEGNGLLAQALVEAHIESGRRPTFQILEGTLSESTR